MNNISSHIYLEDNKFYFDSENYDPESSSISLDYEDGDRIKWIWENKKMIGTLRVTNSNLGLFVIENVAELE
jgi:hypothetical protein